MVTKLSLTRRLVLLAGLWLLFGMIAGGYALSYTFREAVTARFDLKLTGLVRVLAATAVDGDPLADFGGDPDFGNPASGHYWLILSGEEAVDRSRSLTGVTLSSLPPMPGEPTEITLGTAQDSLGLPLRLARTPVGDGTNRTAVVALETTELETEFNAFTRLIVLSSLGLSIGLLIAIALQVGFGLHPLRRLTSELRQIEEGNRDRLSPGWPVDIAPVAGAMNAVLDHDRAVADRARKTAGNLAHALKTELAVISTTEQAAERDRRIQRLKQIIDHHLARAASGGAGVPGVRVDTAAALKAIVAAFGRMLDRQGIALTLDLADPPAFRGQREDFEEMLGNLIENAGRHASSAVRVWAGRAADGGLEIHVDDDGPGLSEAERERASTRGVRLDETGPGSGLGLAIVRDIVGFHDGRMTLQESADGGLSVVIVLPASPRIEGHR